MNNDNSEIKAKITKIVNETGGISLIELSCKLDVPIKTIIKLVRELSEEGKIIIKTK